MKNKLIDILAEYDVFSPEKISNSIIASSMADEFINKILKTIYKEIEKKRPKKKSWRIDGYLTFNQALSDYDKVLKEIFEK